MKRYLHTEEFLRRKRLIAAYLKGLETGNTNLTAAVWLAAETDAELERLLDEINFDYESELELTSFAKDANLVRKLADEHLQTRFEEAEFEKKVLTFGDVAKKLEAKNRVPNGEEENNRKLAENDTPLPSYLTLAKIRRVAGQLKIKFKEKYWTPFFKEATFLTLRQSQQQAFATRRKRELKKKDESGKKTTDK
ncbi:hypothetical protein BH20ACI1_BH20ACI1_12420 [soil metagenome]